MKRILLTAVVLLCANLLTAQSLETSDYRTKGYVTEEGEIQDSGYTTVLTIDGDGKIVDRLHTTMGYLKDGKVQDNYHQTLGYINDDGRVQGSNYMTIGYIKDNGTVQDAASQTIGYAKGVKKEWAAIAFFFFKL